MSSIFSTSSRELVDFIGIYLYHYHMLWQLIFAHLIADYPLQTNELVKAKGSWWGLTLHGTVHLLVMLLLAGRAMLTTWPYLVLLAFIHLGIDLSKNQFSRAKPDWVVSGYLLDQLAHLLSVVFIATSLEGQHTPLGRPLIGAVEAIYGIGYLLVSYVGGITERVLTYQDQSYQKEVLRFFWPRLVARLLFFTAILVPLPGGKFWLILLLLFGLQWLYQAGPYRRRAMLTDVMLVLAGWGFIQESG
jgi:hypothetical protein